MPASELTPIVSDLDGQAIESGVGLEAANADGNFITNNVAASKGKISVIVDNTGGGSPCVVTIAAESACSHGYTHDEGGTVPAGDMYTFGPFNPDRFNASSGIVNITYDQVVAVEVVAVQNNPK